MERKDNSGGASGVRKNLLGSSRPIKGTQDGFVSAQGKGPTLDAHMRPAKGNKILF